MTTEGHRLILVIFAISGLAGCRPAPIVTYATFAPATSAYSPAVGSDNAFDTYAIVAERAEREASKYVARVSFTPGERRAAQSALEPRVKEIAAASKKRCQFQFSPHGPFDPVKYQRGWRLLGLCLNWDIQDAAVAGNFDRAVSDTIVATRFGLDLTGGGAIDASTGLRIADDARRALSLYLSRLSAEQLKTLETGLKGALARKPPISQTISNEQKDMMETLEVLQQHYRDGTLDEVQKGFGPDTREPISYLKGLQPADPHRALFFQTLASYAAATSDYADRLSSAPAVARAKVPGPTVPVDHTWRRLAKYVVHAPLPLLDLNDVTTARTRLFIIEAELTQLRKLHLPLPTDLKGFTPPLSVDPYTGLPFIYRQNGEDYLVYSVGKDGLDNAGQTDSAFLQPDLRLERPTP